MKLLITQQIPRLTKLGIEKGKTYEVEDIVVDSYKIIVPMKRKGVRHVLINEDEGELID